MSGRPQPSKTWGVDLSGKCIIVTGGNRGIGLAMSRQLAQAGAHIAIIYNSSPDAPERAQEIERDFGVTCQAYQQNTAEQKEMVDLVKQIYADIGPIGGVICNAGTAVSKPALEMTREDFDTQFEVNVWGVFNACQACAALWKEHDYKNGRIVITSSMSATIANKDSTQCFYNPSKSAVSMLAKCLAMEWRDMGITVNCISPGVVSTDMTSGMRESGKFDEYKKLVPLGRAAEPDEMAGMAVFLMSDHSSCKFGVVLVID